MTRGIVLPSDRCRMRLPCAVVRNKDLYPLAPTFRSFLPVLAFATINTDARQNYVARAKRISRISAFFLKEIRLCNERKREKNMRERKQWLLCIFSNNVASVKWNEKDANNNRVSSKFARCIIVWKKREFFAKILYIFVTIRENVIRNMQIREMRVHKRHRARCILFFCERKVSFISEHTSEQVSISKITPRVFST